MFLVVLVVVVVVVVVAVLFFVVVVVVVLLVVVIAGVDCRLVNTSSAAGSHSALCTRRALVAPSGYPPVIASVLLQKFTTAITMTTITTITMMSTMTQ